MHLHLGNALQLKVGWAVLIPFPFFALLSYVFDLQHGLLAGTVAYLAYLALILVHEFGHAAIAWALGLKVVAIELHLFHGRCWILPGKVEIRNIAVYLGGVLAQLVLLGVAQTFGIIFKVPDWLAPTYFIWTVWNFVMMASNLSTRAPYDGAVAWRIFPLALRLARVRLNLPVRIAGSPPLRSEVDLASHLVTTPDLRRYLAEMDTRPEYLCASLATLGPEHRGTVSSLLAVVRQTAAMKVPPGCSSPETPANLFSAQMRYGNPGIRTALESIGLDVRGLLFRMAHGKDEGECTAPTDELSGGTVAVRVINDDFTPMELIVQLLVKHLCISRQEAVSLMLKIHQEGATTIRVCSLKDAEALATALNADARLDYAPLFCRLAASGG